LVHFRSGGKVCGHRFKLAVQFSIVGNQQCGNNKNISAQAMAHLQSKANKPTKFATAAKSAASAGPATLRFAARLLGRYIYGK